MSDCGISNEEQLRNWLNRIDTDYQALSKRMSLAYFNQLIGEPFEDMVMINSEISAIMLNKQNHDIAD
ncbi:hypothetical protein K8T06_13770, partial [bacterium]|nr:hypothetical protein [bacterium]